MLNRKHKKRTAKRMLAGVVAIMTAAATTMSVFSAPNQALKDKYNVQQTENNLDSTGVDPTTKYGYVRQSYSGVPGAKTDLILPLEKAVREDGKTVPIQEIDGQEDEKTVTKTAIVWDDRCEAYTWQVDILEDALYEISLGYMPFHNETIPVLRHILIDGKEPYYEAKNFLLPRSFVEKEEVELTSDGDELAPSLGQLKLWQEFKVHDLNGWYEQPLQFYLTKGIHTVSIAYAACDIYLSEVKLTTLTQTPDYDTYFQSHDATYYSGEPLYREAEEADIRSVPALRRGSSGKPQVSPFKPGVTQKNMIGGWYWRKPHDRLTYIFDVPQTGYYKLALNIQQEARLSSAVYRQILIDGEVPFAEVAAYKFDYTGNRYKPVVIGKDENTPYYFYLTEGKHELSFSVVLGDFVEFIEAAQALVDKMTLQYREIVTVTGIEPDVNYDYELDDKIPSTIQGLREDIDEIRKLADISVSISGETSASSSMYALVEELSGIMEQVEEIPGNLQSVLNIQNSISSFISEVSVAPMALDYISLISKDTPTPKAKGTIWDNIAAFCMEFIRSFTKDYDAVSNNDGTLEDSKALEVWIANSREYGELLQRMSNDSFTRQTGIQVKVNILPAGSVTASGLSPLMLTIISGDQPDVVVGSDSGSPVDLAIRDAVVDLSQFEGFEELKSRFFPGAFECVTYNDGVYALPMTMDMPLLFYRTDIMSQLALRVPETWDELTQTTFPSMKQSQYSFYLSSGVGTSNASTTATLNYSMFLYQNGGEFYSEDGLSSTLNTEMAYRAFKQWTDLYIRFDIDVQADLLNHFRQGDIPLAVGSLYDYARIQFAAPELYGRWDVAPIPGTLQSDGIINRAASGSITANLMFDNGENRKQAAFQFLDWWTSTDVQKEYASEIETIVGAESRWFSANVEAFQSLSWDENHLKVMMDWSPFFRTQRNTLGGYLTSRTLTNSWTETVMNQKPAREQIEKAFKETNAEMSRKQKEYGVKR